MNTRFYDLAKKIITPIYNVLWPTNVKGLDNVPTEGGFIMCANHVHARDPVFLAVQMPMRRFIYLGKAELFKNKLLNRILGEKGLGAIPISRGETDMNAIRQSLKVLADGNALGIFPQGTRSPDNTPTPMLNGVSMIAMRAGVPVIPVYFDGPYHPFRRMNVFIGVPVDFSDLGKRYNNETLTAATHRIETAIWGQKNS